MRDKVEALEKEIADLETELSARKAAKDYLENRRREGEETFAYTNKAPPEQEFIATVVVDNNVLKIPLTETDILCRLWKDERLQELDRLKNKLYKINKILEEE